MGEMVKLVEFSDNEYAVVESSFWGDTKYYDLKNIGYKWSKGSQFMLDCIGDFKTANKVYKMIAEKYKVVSSI